MASPANPVITASVRENILAAMLTALNKGALYGGQAPATFYRSRVDAFGASELPAGILQALHEGGQRRSANVSLRKLTARVEIQIAATAPGPGQPAFAADSQFDGLLVYVVQTLTQDDGVRQAGALEIDNSGIDYDVAPAYQDVAAAALDFEIAFAVKANDPSVRSF
jgi:hypothetical protein